MFIQPYLSDGILLKVLQPSFGVPEAGIHMLHTYHDRHIKNIDLKQSEYGPCLLFSSDALVSLQTDDTLISPVMNTSKINKTKNFKS